MKEDSTKLQRGIGLPQAIALYIGAVLGSGVLIVPGLAAELAGPASLLAWGFMILLILPMALSMGLLSAKYPNAGGVSTSLSSLTASGPGRWSGGFSDVGADRGARGRSDGGRLSDGRAGLGRRGQNRRSRGYAGNRAVHELDRHAACRQNPNRRRDRDRRRAGFSFAAALPRMESAHFTPFLPHGWLSVGQAASMLFWCFIGWEAVSHMSEEFKDPQKAAIKGVTAAAIIVGILYFLSALATVGTQSYLKSGSDSSMVWIISQPLGAWGGIVAGVTGLFICMAGIIAYTGAAARVAYAMAREGKAPKWWSGLSPRFHTPVGALLFLAFCFAVVILLYGGGALSLATLIQFPNATFILTYMGGCAAGIKLLKGNRAGVIISWISFIATAAVFPFTGWAMLYPLLIALLFLVIGLRAGRRKTTSLEH